LKIEREEKKKLTLRRGGRGETRRDRSELRLVGEVGTASDGGGEA